MRLFFAFFAFFFSYPISAQVPEWSRNAIWYQIFPERFRDGDANNQPIRESIENHNRAPQSWHPTRWTQDWYKMDKWEKELRGFYDPAVFMRRYGGDLQGVLDKLDYLKMLGINAIYFNPIFYARSMHKYDASSFHHIEPYFGPDPQGDLALMATETSDPQTWKWTKADLLFLKLIQEAHKRDIRIVLDGVFNHSGRDFFAFADLAKNQEKSPYKNWYVVKTFDDPNTSHNEFKYEGWWGAEALPIFADVKTPNGDDVHPLVKQYFMDITKRWQDPNGDENPNDGIDGWRLDVANEVPILFWKDWTNWVKKLNPNAYTVTELWDNGKKFVEDGGFSATKNYHGFAFPIHDFLVRNRITATQFVQQLDERRTQYTPEQAQSLMNLLDSHDTDRIASMIVNAKHLNAEDGYDRNNSPRSNPKYEIRKPNAHEREIQKLVALFQFTYIGAPMVYYGTEAGMWGGDDPDDRKPMVWADLRYDDEVADPLDREKVAEKVTFDHELFHFYQSLIALRKRFHVFSKGDLKWIHHDDVGNTLSYLRFDKTASFLVVLNRSDEPRLFTLPVSAKRIQVVHKTQPSAVAMKQGNKIRVALPSFGGIVLKVKREE